MNQEWTTWSRTADPMQFTGHERDFLDSRSSDVHTYLDYMHARYYVAA